MANLPFPLQPSIRIWLIYLLVMVSVSWVCFGSLADLPLDTHDDELFSDSIALEKDFSFFFSPAAQKAVGSGHPLSDLIENFPYLIWGPDPARYHLFAVALHTLASLLLAYVAWELGLGLELSMTGGLLFLVNVAHFQAVHWISAMDYPVALMISLGAILCCVRYYRTQRLGWLWGFCGALPLGVLAQPAALMAWPFCLYWAWYKEHDLRPLWRSLLPLALLMAPTLAFIYYATAEKTSTAQALSYYSLSNLPAILAGMGRLLLWFVSRLWTTAHWLPLPAYRQEPWELYAGAVALCGLGWSLWRRHWPLSLAAVWIVCMLLPFLLLTETTIRDLPAGPSRYLYLATAGSSLVWAWGLQQAGRVQRWGRLLFLAGLAVLLISSYVNLKKTEAISFYTSGRNYIVHGQTEDGIVQLRRAINRAPGAIPLEEVYFRLASALPYMGEDPIPLLQEGLAQFPNNFLLNIAMAVISTESLDGETRKYSQDLLDHLQEQAEQEGQGENFAVNVSAIYSNQGKGLLRKHEVLGAIHAFERALAYMPGKEQAIVGLGQAYTLLGIQLGEQRQEEKAAQAYAKALELNPGDAIAHVNLGWLQYRAGQWGEAITHYQAVLATGPSIHAQFNLGLAYLAKGEVEAARSAYVQAITRFGAAAGERIGAARDLQALIAEGRGGAVAGEFLHTYWPAVR